MSKTWYPVIRYEHCTECLACFNKCKNSVFTLKGSVPVVVNPEGCVHECHGCGNLCPVGAIVYVGDNTGWIPPGKKNIKDESLCCESNKNNCCGG